MQGIYYKKVGKRYKPVSIYDSGIMDAYPQGSHLVVVDERWESHLYNVEPEFASVLAALRLCRDPLCEVLRRASMYRPSQRAGSKHIEAFNAYKAIVGEDALVTIEGPSINEMIETMEKTLLEHIKKTSPRGTV